MNYSVSSLPGEAKFGAIVTGLKAAALDEPATRRSLVGLWREAGAIVFRGDERSRDFHLKLSRIFGSLIDHVNSRETGSTDSETLNIVWDGRQEIYSVGGRALGSWLPWHIDLIYTSEINRGGMLRAVELPAHGGGQTGFIDRAAAYDALSDELKIRVEGLDVVYRASFDASTQLFGRVPDLRLIQKSDRLAALADKNFVRVVHPMVFTHAETGRKILNLSPWFAESVEGMAEDESAAILTGLVDHCLSDPSLSYFHEWELEDLVLWDNWRMLHSCSGVHPADRRLLTRTTILGDYGLGRLQDPNETLDIAQKISV